MNESIALSPDWGFANLAEALAVPSDRVNKSPALEVLASLRPLYAAIENQILVVIQAKSAAEFRALRGQIFPTYFQAALAFPPLARIIYPPHTLDRLNCEFFCELEADLRDCGLPFFGQAVRDQAMFTAWTLRKIADLASQLEGVQPVDIADSQAADLMKMVEELRRHGIWTRFHLHCLISSMRNGKPMFPEPLELIIDGLRSAVNAYAIVRRAVDILSPRPAPVFEAVEWDEEDESLLYEADNDPVGEVV